MSRPKWEEDFPVRWSHDHHLVRREFAKFLTLGSLGLALGNVWLWAKTLLRVQPAYEGVPVARVDEVTVGGVKLFRYPTESDPAILIRLAEDRFVAYSQKCTHLSCSVYFDNASSRLVCPCHHGYFDPQTGAPTAGPPNRPLPFIELKLDGSTIMAVGVKQG